MTLNRGSKIYIYIYIYIVMHEILDNYLIKIHFGE